MLPIAIISNNREQYSETFIRDHVRDLPGEVHLLSDGYLPSKGPGGLLLYKPAPVWHRLGSGKEPADKGLERGIAAYLLKNGIRVVLAEYGPSGVMMMDICRKLDIPLVVHFHGFDAYRRDVLDYYGKRYPELFQMAAALIAVSRDMRTQLIRLGAPEGKVQYLPYGVDTTLFSPGEVDSRRNYFVACGRFVPKKAPQLTLAAFKKVLAVEPEAQMVMIGDGPLLETCRAEVKGWDLPDAVLFKGVLSQVEIAKILQGALAFVQHSMVPPDGDSEGTPLAILEAGASGLPVIATRHGGIPDVVIHGKTGWLVEEGDMKGMSRYMLELLSDRKKACEMGRTAATEVQSKYHLERYIQGLWDVLRGVSGLNK